MSRRIVRNGLLMVLALFPALNILRLEAQQPGAREKIQVQRPMIPERPVLPGALQLQMERGPLESAKGMKFFKVQRLPVKDAVLTNFSKDLRLQAKPSTMTNQQVMAEENGVARLQSDKATGHMHLMPHWEAIAQSKPQLVTRENAFRIADEFIRKNELILKDVSVTTPQHLVTLSRAEVRQGQNPVVTDVGQTVIFQRKVAEKPVLGNGSQLLVDLGHQGQVVGFKRAWNGLAEAAVQPELKSDQEIYSEVERQVRERIHGQVNVKVAKLHLVYYGNDKDYVQPAYFYSIQVDVPGVKGRSFLSGVVAAAKNTPEPIALRRPPTELPSEAKLALNVTAPSLEIPEGDPTIGRYVVRQDSNDWVDDANEFRSGLIDGHSSAFPALTFGDYYWDQPAFWTSSESSFVDRWNITLMEGHGNTWLFTTRSNCCDVVNLNSGSQPGYGNLPGNSMRYLILKGCSIIPAPPDRANWADPWWRIFKGLHQAVGFRTEMYIDDDISYGFAKNVSSNHRVLDSWFAATNGSSSYQWERFWGSWGDQIYGYGTVVMIPGREGEGIYHTDAAPPASSAGLSIWWQH
jgi:hypothetical protein